MIVYVCLCMISAAAADTIEITAESEAAFYPSMDANFQFDTPLVIQVLDSDGYIVTDGPDANLVRTPLSLSLSLSLIMLFSILQAVNVTVDPPGTCLSSDSTFELVNGVGTFMGSICEPNVNDIRLKFSVTSALSMSTISTSWSPYFNVTGQIIVMLYSMAFNDLMFVCR